MGKPVSLDDLTRHVAGRMSGEIIVFHKETGVVDSYLEDPLDPQEDDEDFEGPEWQHLDFCDADWDWQIMRQFAEDQPSAEARETLWRLLNGPHPFRNFRNEVRRRGLLSAWDADLEARTRVILRARLSFSRIPFTETKVPAS